MKKSKSAGADGVVDIISTMNMNMGIKGVGKESLKRFKPTLTKQSQTS